MSQLVPELRGRNHRHTSALPVRCCFSSAWRSPPGAAAEAPEPDNNTALLLPDQLCHLHVSLRHRGDQLNEDLVTVLNRTLGTSLLTKVDMLVI